MQLEFNLEDKNPLEIQLAMMQKFLDQKCTSMDSVRKKLFAELSRVQKSLLEIKNENEDLKRMVCQMNSERQEWQYLQDDWLFQISLEKLAM